MSAVRLGLALIGRFRSRASVAVVFARAHLPCWAAPFCLGLLLYLPPFAHLALSHEGHFFTEGALACARGANFGCNCNHQEACRKEQKRPIGLWD